MTDSTAKKPPNVTPTAHKEPNAEEVCASAQSASGTIHEPRSASTSTSAVQTRRARPRTTATHRLHAQTPTVASSALAMTATSETVSLARSRAVAAIPLTPSLEPAVTPAIESQSRG